MSTPESHELESFFEKLTQPPPAHARHGQGDPAEEFNALFRKLSALDELNWAPDADHPAQARHARAKSAPARQAPAAAAADGSASEDAVMARAAMPAPRLTQEEADKIAAVVDAEAVAPAEQPPPASATPAPRNAAPRPKHRGTAVAKVVAADAVTATAPRPGLMDRAGRVLKIATVSLALFGLGLGAVWAALTLPHRANHAQPTVAERADPGSNGATLAAGAAPPSVELPATAAELLVTEVETKPAGRTTGASTIPAPAAVGTSGTAAGPVEPVAPRQRMAAAPNAPVASSVESMQAVDQGGFALQVGACASEQCLANYRSLLANFVTAENIRVIAASSGEGAAVQRVRIAPLDLEQARKLKVAMAADARLRNAYVITLN